MNPPAPASAPLAERSCKACSGEAARVTDAQAATMLGQLPGWERAGDEIAKTFTFNDYHQTMAFVNAIAWVAHREDHHPDLEVGYTRCRVRYSTHSIGGLSENDFISAAKVEAMMKV